VQKGVKDALLKRIVAHAREWPMGGPLNPANRVGALISKAHFEKVASYLEKGPKVLLGGKAETSGRGDFGGRDNGIQAHDQYTRIKTIWVDLADDTDEAVD
jgi:Aldehyde dehydrogenase family